MLMEWGQDSRKILKYRPKGKIRPLKRWKDSDLYYPLTGFNKFNTEKDYYDDDDGW